MSYLSLWKNRQNGSSDLSTLFADLDQQWGALFGGLPGLFDAADEGVSRPSQVKSRWYEAEDAFLLRLDLPGLKAKDIDLQWNDGTLELSAERVFEGSAGHEAKQAIKQSFRLPREVEAERAKARYEDGVLSLELPKSEKAKPRRIAVKG